jgi:hypothetical protein
MGNCLKIRLVVVRFKTTTGDGEREIALLTSLSQTVAIAEYVAQLYRGGWSVETLFHTVTKNFEGEIFSLGYPKTENFHFLLGEGFLQYFSGCPKGFGQCTRCRYNRVISIGILRKLMKFKELMEE